jgi:hypothetical protein
MDQHNVTSIPAINYYYLSTPKRCKVITIVCRSTGSSCTTTWHIILINQQNILRQRGRSEMYSPSILSLPCPTWNNMCRISPNLFSRPLVVSLWFIRDSVCPENALDVLEWRSFNVGIPSLLEEGMVDFREQFPFSCYGDCSEDVVTMFEIFARKMVDSGGS